MDDLDAAALQHRHDLVLVVDAPDAAGEPGLGEVGRALVPVDLVGRVAAGPDGEAEVAVDRMGEGLLLERRGRHHHRRRIRGSSKAATSRGASPSRARMSTAKRNGCHSASVAGA